MRKKILIIYTGGTIGMKDAGEGFKPVANFLDQAMAEMFPLHRMDMPSYDIHEYHPLIDSVDADPSLWNKLAETIQSHYAEYDGFLILHGTDTMAYTASALSFMLEDLAKPVMLTGAQVPLYSTRTDARENLINSLYLLQHYPVPEVTICFDNKLYRGNRTTKIDALAYSAYKSPNFPTLIRLATEVELFFPVERKLEKDSVDYVPVQPVALTHLVLFPGIQAKYLEVLREMSLQALIIKSYGIGNAPSNNKTLLKLLQDLNDQGVVLVNSSQCLYVNVTMNRYATGKILASCGAVSARDMTDEAIITKLHYLFAKGFSSHEIKEKLALDLRGELTE